VRKETLIQEERIRRLRKRYPYHYLVSQPTQNLQTDNGSEFALEFERTTTKLNIQRYFSRARTPKDNSEIERFNQTLEYEWLYNSNLSLDPEEFNPRLTEWLIEYNFNRPQQSFGYIAPVEYIEKNLLKSTAQCYLCGQPAHYLSI
jgi:transposase InsO family protein